MPSKRFRPNIRIFLTSIVLVFVLTACSSLTLTPITAPAVEPEGASVIEPGDLPAAVEYSLGETTIVQPRFPEESRFRHMPARPTP
jgi:hypothetical protein